MPASHTLTFLGTGASCGVPSFYCGCKACKEARINPRAARSCACLLISGAENTLIDASPDLRTQLVQASVEDIARVLLTHEHFDHTGGIPQLEYYARLKSHTPLQLYAGAETLRAIEHQYGFMREVLEPHLIVEGQTFEFDEIAYTPLPAVHSPGCVGYLIETLSEHRTRVAYFPDTAPLPTQVWEQLGALDHLIIDATFNGRNWMPGSHLSIDEAIACALSLGAQHTWLTHLAMHYDVPITLAELEDKLFEYGGSILPAYDGLVIEL